MRMLRGMLLAFSCLISACDAYANADSGAQWLAGQLGSQWGAANSNLSTSFQATAEAVRALRLYGYQPQLGPQLSFINSEPYSGAEYLARKIVSNREAGLPVSNLVAQLLNEQNSDGSFGEASGHDGNTLDTAFALEGLASEETTHSQAVHRAVQYLLLKQSADGSWGDLEGDSLIATTAVAMRSIWLHRKVAGVPAAVSKAKEYLLQQRGLNDLWPETFASSLALISILPVLLDRSEISATANAFSGEQLPNGSWHNDAYTTALALRVLAHLGQAVSNPDLASLAVRVLDGQTGGPLSGVVAALMGPTSVSATSNADGRVSFSGLQAPGDYQVQLTLPNYASVTAVTRLEQGQAIDLGSIHMLKVAGATTGTVRGRVVDAESGLGVGDAIISLTGGPDTVTNAQGHYELGNVPANSYLLSASKVGYSTASSPVNVQPGGVVLFSPSLASNPFSRAIIAGRIVDATTGQPLAGARIVLGGQNQDKEAITDATGGYRIEGLALGVTSVVASLSGYDSVSISYEVRNAGATDFSPKLYAAGSTPSNANTASAFGTIVDASTNLPIAGVSVSIVEAGASVVLSTDGLGGFHKSGILAETITIVLNHPSYTGYQLEVPIAPLENRDLGQFRLRLRSADALLPDLLASSVTRAMAVTDPASLNVSGSIEVTARNEGTAAAGAFEILAFSDYNSDGIYTSGVDSILGKSTVTRGLAVGEEASPVIQVSGLLPFRDAPLSVFVDSRRVVIERNESNNVQTTRTSCETEPIPGAVSMVRKWTSGGQVTSTPMVGPLLDTNGDGAINQFDTPMVVAVTHVGWPDGVHGTLRVFNGETGAQVWAVPDAGFFAKGQVAIADLEGDGVPEIVTISNYPTSGVTVVNNDGTLRWGRNISFSDYNGDPLYSAGVADLDHDGVAEVIAGNRVYRANGTPLWTGTPSGLAGGLTVVYDLNLDGSPEVIVGRTVYRSNGTVLWTANVPAGEYKTAVGNFDQTPEPELVVMSSQRVSLVSSTGQTLWTATPFADTTGVPAVGDLDRDGIPEIVAADRTSLRAIRADGSVMWSQTTFDSSSRSGPTIFDLNGDGKVEVIYNDETQLRVFDGESGALLYITPNSNATAYENPVVVDVDGDGDAEILVSSYSGGVRVYESAGAGWMKTRKIWNEHAYHITNIDDDAKVPRHVVSNAGEFNNFRVNGLRDPRGTPDLTASILSIEDAGLGNPLVVRARIGNGGRADVPALVNVRFFAGNPGQGGSLLGERDINGLAAGSFEDVAINVDGLAPSEIHVVVDQGNQVAECDESNNSHQVPVQAQSARGQIAMTTDAPAYGASASAILSGVARNVGSLANGFSMQITVEDLAGGVVVSFDPEDLGVLEANQAATLDRVWSVAGVRAGNYVLRGVLRRDDGALVDEDSVAFTVLASELRADLRVSTDKPVYGTTERVRIDALARNLAANLSIASPGIEVIVLGPGGAQVFNQALTLTELAPGGAAQRQLEQLLSSAPEGAYTVQARLLDAGVVIAAASASYQVQEDLELSLAGSVTATQSTVFRGDTLSCTDAITNRGTQPLIGQPVRRQLVRMDGDAVLASEDLAVDLASGASQSLSRSIDTDGLAAPGDYACVLQTEIDGSWKALGYAAFQVTEPPVVLSGLVAVAKESLEQGEYQTCTDTVRNDGKGSLAAQAIRQILRRPSDGTVLTQTDSHLNLSKNGSQTLSRQIDTLDMSPGDYVCEVQAEVGGTWQSLASNSFSVTAPVPHLSGTVVVADSEIVPGDPQSCTDTLRNDGRLALNHQLYRQILKRLDVPGTVSSTDGSVTLAPQSGQTFTRSISTANLQMGSYACTLEAKVGESYQPIASATFTVTRPPFDIDADLQIGPRGRLLVLMDPPGATSAGDGLCHNGVVGLDLELDVDPPLEPDAVINVKVVNLLGFTVDAESIRLADVDGVVNAHIGNNNPLDLALPRVSADSILISLTGQNVQGLLGSNYRVIADLQRATGTTRLQTGLMDLACNATRAVGDVLADVFTVVGLGADRHNSGQGIGDGPDQHSAAQQRQYLEQLLDEAGWSYTIHTDPAAFAADLRSGRYVSYALLSEYEVLDEPTQKLLREAINRGDGLLVAGRHDVRTRVLDPLLGLKYKSTHLAPQAIEVLPNSTVTNAGTSALQEGDRVQRIHQKGADALGRVLPVVTHGTVVSRHAFGDGKTIAIGFDLLAEAELAGLASRMADLIRQPLTAIHPDQATPRAGRLVPLRLRLENRAVPTTGRITITPSLGSYVTVTSDGEIVSGGGVTWTVPFAENQVRTLDVWLQLPLGGLPVTVTATVEALDGNQAFDEGTVTLNLQPVAPASLADIKASLQAYVAVQPQGGLITQLLGLILNTRTPARRALDHLLLAEEALAVGNLDIALEELLAASDQLLRDPDPQIPALRRTLSDVITDTASLL